MVRAIQFELGHVDLFRPKTKFKDLKKDLEHTSKGDTTMVSLIYLDTVLAIAGLNHLRQGVAEAWVIPSIHVDRFKLGFFKKIKKLIDFSFDSLELHRIEIGILVDWKQGIKWAETLGFEREGIMKAYDQTMRDQYLYARIKWPREQ